MTQAERRIFLIKYLLDEAGGSTAQIPNDENAQRILLRGLMNVREPKPIADEFLKVQDEYLTERKIEKGVVAVDEIENTSLVFDVPYNALGIGGVRSKLAAREVGATAEPRKARPPRSGGNARIFVWQGDITRLEVDAIVNAANSGMTGCYQPNHACIDNAIHTFAGVQLRLECAGLAKEGVGEMTGRAKITGAHNLPSRWVLHTVGPIVRGRLNERHCLALKSCYKSCLGLAAENECKSIAFCCISTGVFMFPKERAAKIAVETVLEFFEKVDTKIGMKNGGEMKVVFNVFSDEDRMIYEKLLAGIANEK